MKMLVSSEIQSHGEFTLMPRQYTETKAQHKSTQNERTSRTETGFLTKLHLAMCYAWRSFMLSAILAPTRVIADKVYSKCSVVLPGSPFAL